MGRVFGPAYAKWVFGVAAMMLVCVIWASAAHAQTNPFGSQYGAPPTAPPGGSGSGAGSSGSPSASASSASSSSGAASGNTGALSNNSGSEVSLLPDTGGLPVAPVLLGGALLGGAGLIAVRRKVRR